MLRRVADLCFLKCQLMQYNIELQWGYLITKNYTFFIRTHFIGTLRLRFYRKIKNNLRTMTRLDATTQKKLQGREIGQINWNLIHQWTMNEQNTQAQKKLYINKVYAIKILSCNIVCGHSLWFRHWAKCDIHEF